METRKEVIKQMGDEMKEDILSIVIYVKDFG